MPFANKKGTDQLMHPRSLISAFVVCCPNSRILISISKISSLYLASVATQAGVSLHRLQTPKTGFLVTWLILFAISLSFVSSVFFFFTRHQSLFIH